MILKCLLMKEMRVFKSNPFLPRLALLYPIIVMLIMPWMATFEISRIKVVIVNQDNSQEATRLIQKINASEYINLKDVLYTYDNAMKYIEKGDCDLILHIPINFGESLTTELNSEVFIGANAVNSVKAQLCSSYINQIILDFVSSIQDDTGIRIENPIKTYVTTLYNPHLSYRYFMAPALLIIILLLFCGFLPTLNIVSEKERGTLEQMNVTPISSVELIISKMLFYGGLGIIVFTIALFVGKFVYGIDPYNKLGTIYAAATLFLLFISSFGLLVSNFSNTLLQAVFTMFFFIMIFMLLSGIFTPINSMPNWAQWITHFLPSKYFVNIMRSCCLKGAGFTELYSQFIPLFISALVMTALAVFSYRKREQ